jgi:hypothetical protein
VKRSNIFLITIVTITAVFLTSSIITQASAQYQGGQGYKGQGGQGYTGQGGQGYSGQGGQGQHHQGQHNGQFTRPGNYTRSENPNAFGNRTMYQNQNRTMFENQFNKTMVPSQDNRHGPHDFVLRASQQDIDSIHQAEQNQTIAAEVNIGNQSTTSIDNTVSVQTTNSTADSMNINVSAPSQTGPKVIVFNLNSTTINLQNLNNLGIMYDGQLIHPAANVDAVLHGRSTDTPTFAVVITQSGVQVLVLVPHFSTHTITIMNMSQLSAPTVPEFPIASIILVIATVSIVVVSRIKQVQKL